MPDLPEATNPWDSVAHLRTREEVAAYLDAALVVGADDPKFIAQAFGVAARAYGVSQLSRETGIARENLYRSLSSKGNPSLSTLCKVTRALGLGLRIEPV